MSEIKTSNKEQLAQWMQGENLEVLNNTQLCAKLFEMETLLKDTLSNVSDLNERIKALELGVSNA
jgi:hypothetical protein